MSRVNIRAILADAHLRRQMMVPALIAIQAREGIVTSREQAESAYDKVQQAAKAGGALVFDDDPTDNTDWLDPLRSLK